MKMDDLTKEEFDAVTNQVDPNRVQRVVVLTQHEHKQFLSKQLIQRGASPEIPDDADAKLFLSELTELSRKHGIAIMGCGCCGSPYLKKIPERFDNGYYKSSEYADNIRFVRADEYDSATVSRVK